MTKLKLMTIALDDWEKLRKENTDLRAKLEAAENKNDQFAEAVFEMNGQGCKLRQERDDLRRQNSVIKEKFSIAMEGNANATKRWLNRIDGKDATIAALRGTIQSILDIVDLSYGCADGYGYAERLNEAKIYARQALTGSGDNRYARVIEAAKKLMELYLEHNNASCNFKCAECLRSSYCQAKELAAALGDGE